MTSITDFLEIIYIFLPQVLSLCLRACMLTDWLLLWLANGHPQCKLKGLVLL